MIKIQKNIILFVILQLRYFYYFNFIKLKNKGINLAKYS